MTITYKVFVSTFFDTSDPNGNKEPSNCVLTAQLINLGLLMAFLPNLDFQHFQKSRLDLSKCLVELVSLRGGF
jgi:hypothetical protein